VVTYVAHVGGAKKGVADGMDEDIGIRVAQEAECVGNEYTTQPQVAVGNQLVDIVAHAYSVRHR
jgi:hypothetical protein